MIEMGPNTRPNLYWVYFQLSTFYDQHQSTGRSGIKIDEV